MWNNFSIFRLRKKWGCGSQIQVPMDTNIVRITTSNAIQIGDYPNGLLVCQWFGDSIMRFSCGVCGVRMCGQHT